MFILKDFVIGTVLITAANTIIWFTTNSQFFSKWAAENRTLIALVAGMPTTYLCVWSSKYFYQAFGNLAWPGRFMAFVSGTILMAVLASYFLGEGISLKTGICLVLSLAIVVVQVWM
tara:strand:- start:17 stop:367 length:351 start_codon:yes stop_codon:yes gene_type:complete